MAKGNADSPYRHPDRIGQRYLQNRRLGILVNRLLETHFPTRFYTASALSAPSGHLPFEGKAIHTRGEAATIIPNSSFGSSFHPRSRGGTPHGLTLSPIFIRRIHSRTKTRGFEILSTWQGKDIHLPERKTEKSAGYDIECGEDIDLIPHQVTLIKTGLKAYMKDDEYLAIFIRSSMAIKKGLFLANSTGIIDADYYNNEDNEGHLMVAVYNTKDEPFHVNKGDRVAQGIFTKYLTTDDDHAEGVRTGGVGSTGVK